MKRILIILSVCLTVSIITICFLGLTVIDQRMTIQDQTEAIAIWKKVDDTNRTAIETYQGLVDRLIGDADTTAPTIAIPDKP